jgi:hypothetical protein
MNDQNIDYQLRSENGNEIVMIKEELKERLSIEK